MNGQFSSSRRKEVSLLKPWFLATRPKTLAVSFVPVFVGTFLAKGQVSSIDWSLALLVLLSSLCIQIGTNLINDALDFKKGSDREDRLGPTRMTQAGILSYKKVLVGGFLSFSLAFLCGIPLFIVGGWPFFTIILVSVLCGYLYTGGPYPLAYYGLSDVFIWFFFGLVSTCAVYYLQVKHIDKYCLLAANQVGFLAVVPNAINNLRDVKSDARANKNTLAVRFGLTFARLEITSLTIGAFILGIAWTFMGYVLMTFLPLLALPIALKNIQSIWQTEPSKQYNEFLGKSVMTQFIFSLLLMTGYWLS